MEQKRSGQDEKGVGITNRGLEQEEPGQEYVMDSIDGMEADGKRDDLGTGDRIIEDGTQMRRNLELAASNEDDLTLTPDMGGGERHIDDRDGYQDHSHH